MRFTVICRVLARYMGVSLALVQQGLPVEDALASETEGLITALPVFGAQAGIDMLKKCTSAN